MSYQEIVGDSNKHSITLNDDENLTFFLLKFGNNLRLIQSRWERSEIKLSREERLLLGKLLGMSDEDLLYYKSLYVSEYPY